MTPTEFFKEYRPYKLWIGSLDEYSQGKHNYKGYFNTIGVEEKWTYMFPKEERPHIWVCILYVGSFSSSAGYEVRGDRWIPTQRDNHSGWTYWYCESKTKPTPDDALYELVRFLQDFNEDYSLEGFIEHLDKMKNDFCTDLNTLNLEIERIKLRYASFMRNHIGELICGEQWYGSTNIEGRTYWSKSGDLFNEFIANFFHYVEY